MARRERVILGGIGFGKADVNGGGAEMVMVARWGFEREMRERREAV